MDKDGRGEEMMKRSKIWDIFQGRVNGLMTDGSVDGKGKQRKGEWETKPIRNRIAQ